MYKYRHIETQAQVKKFTDTERHGHRRTQRDTGTERGRHENRHRETYT